MAQLNIGSVTMGEYDRDHFVVMSRLARGSVRGNTGSILTNYVRRKWNEYEKILGYVARKAGISEQDCFDRLLKGESVEQILGEKSADVPLPDDEITEMKE